MVGHVSPEAARGGPIAAVRDGDRVTIDVDDRVVHVDVDDGEIAERLAAWVPPRRELGRGVLARYAAAVGSASDGAVLQPAVDRGGTRDVHAR
jgi:dihydroxy-acid dehydratase